jgi:hypothetical protein
MQVVHRLIRQSQSLSVQVKHTLAAPLTATTSPLLEYTAAECQAHSSPSAATNGCCYSATWDSISYAGSPQLLLRLQEEGCTRAEAVAAADVSAGVVPTTGWPSKEAVRKLSATAACCCCLHGACQSVCTATTWWNVGHTAEYKTQDCLERILQQPDKIHDST